MPKGTRARQHLLNEAYANQDAEPTMGYHSTIQETEDEATAAANATHFLKSQRQMIGTMKSDLHSIQLKESELQDGQQRMEATINSDLIRDVQLTPQ